MKIYKSKNITLTAEQIWNILMRIEPPVEGIKVYLQQHDGEAFIIADSGEQEMVKVFDDQSDLS